MIRWYEVTVDGRNLMYCYGNLQYVTEKVNQMAGKVAFDVQLCINVCSDKTVQEIGARTLGSLIKSDITLFDDGRLIS